jgi:hypothetical protein
MLDRLSILRRKGIESTTRLILAAILPSIAPIHQGTKRGAEAMEIPALRREM